MFVNGHVPRRRGRLVLFSAIAGFVLTVIWSAPLVDEGIGQHVTGALLGDSAAESSTSVTGIAAGVLFAFVSGLAGTFTACNIAVFGAMTPALGSGEKPRLRQTLQPVGWLAVGMIAVSAVYGFIVGLVGTSMPQFDTAASAPGTVPARLIQSMIVFGVVGIAMIGLGLTALRFLRDPFARTAGRFPYAPMVFLGVLVGGFLIGRPFPLFRKLFRSAAESGNPFYGAGAFVLQSLGNITITVLLFLLLSKLAGGSITRRLAANPARTTAITAAALLVAGVFTVMYWDVRLLASTGILPWYPLAPWV